MSRGYSVEQWRIWIAQQRESGLSIAAFCDSIGVSENAFYVRRRRLAETNNDVQAFVPLSISDAAISNSGASVEIDLPCGAIVRVSDHESVRCVLSTLLDNREPS